jgi:sulfite reductase (NADPH) hemoprotein beta-component
VVPQYFVMVGGGVDEKAARFGRLAAKVPARRVPEVLDRLVALYELDRQHGESATAFFGRVDLPKVKGALADLEQMSENTADAQDYIDLGEDTEFRPETQEGECAR